MKRARIKAMVTVPTRRKGVPEFPHSETINETQCEEKNKNVSDNTSVTLQPSLKDCFREKLTNETLLPIEQTHNEQSHLNDESIQPKEKSTHSSDEPKKEVVPKSEIQNMTPIANPKLTQTRLSFVKPTPKLDNGNRVRLNSIQGSGASASESEDDSTKVTSTSTNHTRNELVQSIKHTTEPIVGNTKTNFETKSKVIQKKRTLVSESAKKLAEARREFHLKHENKIPDRSKLTMYDLIYYNPVTNPMKKSTGSGMLTRQILECQPEEFPEEENEDDPTSAMPVPQVKVGPDGQLIIDEQSLVIEQTNAKRNREILAKEVIVDDDNNGSGFYKKRHKSKEWSKWETLKFYKTLNTVGTDFLLMQSLFPNRTRQEIKLKFKKEEKLNPNLVEKALAYHQDFDTELLEKSLATFENSEKEQLKTQEKPKKHEITETKKIKSGRKRTRIVASSIAEVEESDEDHDGDRSVTETDNVEECNQYQQSLKKTIRRGYNKTKEEKKKSEISLTEIADVESLNSYNNLDSDSEIYHVRPTRSGRLPKVKKLQGPDINSLDAETVDYRTTDHENPMLPKDNTKVTDNVIFDNSNTDTETYYTDSVKTVIPNIDQVEPGSLVILSKELPEEPGKSVLQVYMVSSNIESLQQHENSNITPVNLPPELLATVTTRLSNVESLTVKEEF